MNESSNIIHQHTILSIAQLSFHPFFSHFCFATRTRTRATFSMRSKVFVYLRKYNEGTWKKIVRAMHTMLTSFFIFLFTFFFSLFHSPVSKLHSTYIIHKTLHQIYDILNKTDDDDNDESEVSFVECLLFFFLFNFSEFLIAQRVIFVGTCCH